LLSDLELLLLELLELCERWLDPDAEDDELCALLCVFLYDLLLLRLALKLFLLDELELWCLEEEWWRCLRTQILRSFNFRRRSKSEDAEDECDDDELELCLREKLLRSWRLVCFLRLLTLTELDDELFE